MKTKKDDILRSPALLTPFHCLCYANLKKYTFDHHFSFPVLPSKWAISAIRQADPQTLKLVDKYIATSPPEQRGFFIITPNDRILPLQLLPTINTEPVRPSLIF